VHDKLTELKAEAYDCIAQTEFYQRRLMELNQQITDIINQEEQK